MRIRIIGSILVIIMLLTIVGCNSAASGSGQPQSTAPSEKTQAASEQLTKDPAVLTAEQVRTLAFGAVLTSRNPMDYDTLFGAAEGFIKPCKEALSESYSTDDHDSAIETLEWFKTEGHRLSADPQYYGYDEIYAIISRQVNVSENEFNDLSIEAQAYDAVKQALMEDYNYTEDELAAITTVSAWDYDRMITVARWCYGNDYISEEEAWEYINYAAENGAADYSSWRSYFAGVMFGRAIWSEADEFSDNKIADTLLKDKKSIYNTVSFNQEK